MIIPFESTNTVKLTSPYGERELNGQKNFHSGYDLVGVGSKVITAVQSGTVVRSRIVTDRSNRTWEWGNYVCIKTKDGYFHYYCHMDSRAVVEGQVVKAGEQIGIMGNTGYSFGAHLHFEARKADGKTTVCPETVLGIPNQVGTYEISTLEADLNILQKAEVINSPDYWKNTAPTVKYLPELIHNMAKEINKNGYN